MKLVAGAAILLVVAGCGQPQPEQKPQLSADEVTKMRKALPRMLDACIQKMRWGGIDAVPQEVDECYEMTPRQTWRGLWRDDFEGSTFCPAPATKCGLTDENASEPHIWLEYSLPAPKDPKANPFGGLYEVEFIGRRTKYGGNFGHMGVFEHEMLVDRMISIREIEPPPME